MSKSTLWGTMRTDHAVQELSNALDFAKAEHPPTEHISGRAIALYRIAAGLSSAEVASAMGVSRQRVSGIEAHKVTPATAKRVREIIEGLLDR